MENAKDNRKNKKKRIVVAMSGGVDSSVTAAILYEQGYDVVGITLKLYDNGDENFSNKRACCTEKNIYDAKKVALKIGFPHYVLDYQDSFQQSVIDDFVQTYMKGHTPIPCVKCNQSVKFNDLLKVAKELGADYMATGHYIRKIINERTGKAELHKGSNKVKDQSYFLFATTQEQLDFLMFPIGDWDKEKTRAEAKRLGLQICDKPDSQGICFVPNNDYASVVKKYAPSSEQTGNIVDKNGRILGTHSGIINYTIGQRKGLGIGGGNNENNDPFYVIRIEPEKNLVIVGTKEELARKSLEIEKCNWLIEGENYGNRIEVDVKIRSVSDTFPATLILKENNTAQIIFKNPQYGIAPGQAAVCYDKTRILGGGWIV